MVGQGAAALVLATPTRERHTPRMPTDIGSLREDECIVIPFAAIPVAQEALAGQHYMTSPDLGHFVKTSSVPILIPELASVIGQYAIGFQELEQGVAPVVLTDIGFNRNVYISREGRWMCRYLPLCLQMYPFCLGPNSAGESVLSVAEDRIVSEAREGSLPLFGEDGSLSSEVQERQANLEKLRDAHRSTLAQTKLLCDEGLIVDWPLRVRLKKDEEPVQVEGLYRIDPEKLVALSGNKLENLRDHGVLTFALSQPMSVQHTNILLERAAHLMRQEAPSKTATEPVPTKSRFDLSDDDKISF